jgi:hypothetical protein
MLEIFDLFGRENSMRIKGLQRFRINIGGFLSLLLILLSTLAFVAFGRDIFEKNYPTILFNSKYIDATFLVWKNEIFLLNLQHFNGTPTSKEEGKKIFDIKINYNDNNASLVDIGKQYIQTPYNMTDCKKDKIIRFGLI